MATQQTAPTQYVTAADGRRFAYRRLSRHDHVNTAVPLLMHTHFRANMDFWDPALINALAVARPVVLFDQAGIGRSSGEIPTTFQGWADAVIAFVTALRMPLPFDLLGFSMGGAAVQMVALTAPHMIRRLILAGTSASAPSKTTLSLSPSTSPLAGLVHPRENAPREPIALLATATTPTETERALAYSFFPNNDAGRAAFAAYWARVMERDAPGEQRLLTLLSRGEAGTKRQLASYRHWSTPGHPENSFDRLAELGDMPVLVLNGDEDVLIPTSRSWELLKRIPNAQLVIYPRAGHGFLYQYAEVVATHVNLFLDGEECVVSGQGAKL